MSMTWGEIYGIFLTSAGNTEDAAKESWQHLNYAHRRITSSLDLPELHVPDATITTTADQDWITAPSVIRSIDWIEDTTTGRKLDPEPGGMRGRARYMESGEVRPPTGVMSFYVPKGNKIYLRDTPDSADQLLVSFWAHPDNVGDADIDDYPLTTQEYDMALAKMALGNFFDFHPPILPDGQVDHSRAQMLTEKAGSDLDGIRTRVTDENLDRRQYQQQPGYDFGVRGR